MRKNKKMTFLVTALSIIFTAFPLNTMTALAEEPMILEDSVQLLDAEESDMEVSVQSMTEDTEQLMDFSLDSVMVLDDLSEQNMVPESTLASDADTISVQEYWYEKYFAANESVVLEVHAASSTGALSYEWQQFDSASKTYQKITDNPTAKNAQLELGILREGSYQFSCRLSDNSGNSEKYIFCDVYVGEHISVTPSTKQTFSIKSGESVTMAFRASSNIPGDTLTYQWSFTAYDKTMQALSNQHFDSMTVIPSKTGTYSCTIKSTKGKNLSETISFQVSVDSGLHIAEDPVLINGEIGSEVTLRVPISNTQETLTYQWLHQIKSNSSYIFAPIEGATQSSCKITVAPKVMDYYICKVDDGRNQVEYSFYLSPSKKLQILTPDTERMKTVHAGETVVLKIQASTSAQYGSVQYQWNMDPYGKENITGDTLTIENITQNSMYTCVVSDLCHTEAVNFYISVTNEISEKTALDFDTAAEIQAGQSQEAVIAFLNSSMYFKFVPKHSGNYRLFSDSSTPSKYVYVFDADQKFLYGSPTMKLSCHMDAGKTYYIQTGYSFSEQTIGSYPLNLTYTGECSWDNGTITKEPTCTEKGTLVRTCAICQATKEETLSANGHSCSEEWIIEKKATCAEHGMQYRECVNCHERMETAEIPVTDEHTYEKGYTVTKAPTVLTEGWEVRKCSICHKEDGRGVQKLTGTIKLTSKKLKLQVKNTANLSALVTGLAAGDSIQSWESSNKAVAAIKQNGLVTGKKTGTATITVKLASGTSAKITIVVQKKTVPATKVSIESNKLSLAVGKSKTLKPIVTPITSSQKPVFKSLNKKIATVNSKGKVTAKAPGKATILITAGKKSVKVTVTVPKPALKSIKNIPKSKTLKKGKSFILRPKANPTGAAAKFTYDSSNRTVATVSSSGKIKAKKKGTTVITIKSGKITASCKVKVK